MARTLLGKHLPAVPTARSLPKYQTYGGVRCRTSFVPKSRRELPQHRADLVGDDLEVGVDGCERARRLEDVEVAVERDLVADLGLLVVDPVVGSVGSTSRSK